MSFSAMNGVYIDLLQRNCDQIGALRQGGLYVYLVNPLRPTPTQIARLGDILA